MPISCSLLRGKQPNLLREQIRLALGDTMGYDQKSIEFKGSSIELRLVAEDTNRGFAPWIGTISQFSFPQEDWAAVYTHVPFDRPYTIPSEYDPNLALVLVWGDDMAMAKNRARQFLDGTVIDGRNSHDEAIMTNIPYLRGNLERLLTF